MKIRIRIDVAVALLVILGASLAPTNAEASIIAYSNAENPGLVILTASTANTSPLDYLFWESMRVQADFTYPGGNINSEWTTHMLQQGETGILSWVFTATPNRGRYTVRGSHSWSGPYDTVYDASYDDIYVNINTP